jgi:phenylacetate-CoA ligase
MQLLIALQTLRSQSRRKRSELENFRDRRIRELVAHAYANVPFYKRLYDSHGVSPGKVRGFGDLEMLPLTRKSEYLRTSVNDLVARGVDPRTLRMRVTTGTTGEPISVRRTSAESTLLRLFRFQAFRSIGVRRTDLSVGIRLRRPGSDNPPLRMSRRIANRAGVYPRVSLVAENPMQLLGELKRLAPAILGGVPGLLSNIVARWPAEARDEMRSAKWPRLVIAGGERITPSVRTHLHDVFGAPVLGIYSSEEFNLIGVECQATGAYHVSDASVALEVLDDTRAVKPGETGQPVGTALHSFAAPIIRYPLGDLVTQGTTQCECGVQHSTIGEIQGRLMHYLEFSDGAVFHHVKIEQAVGCAASWVRLTQISQPSIDRLVVRIAPVRDPSAEEIENVGSSLEEFLDHRVAVDVVIDPDLGPEDGEKFRPVIPLPGTS